MLKITSIEAAQVEATDFRDQEVALAYNKLCALKMKFNACQMGA